MFERVRKRVNSARSEDGCGICRIECSSTRVLESGRAIEWMRRVALAGAERDVDGVISESRLAKRERN